MIQSPEEALAMSYMYLNKYKRFQDPSMSSDPLDAYVCLSSDAYIPISRINWLITTADYIDTGLVVPVPRLQVLRMSTKDARNPVSCPPTPE